MSKERCNVCDELTGHAGSGEDSVFIDTPNGEIGPLCPECLDAIRAFVDDDTGASKALAAAKAEIERLQQQSEAQHKSYGEVVGRLNAAEAELLRQLQTLTEELAHSMNTARDTQGLLTCERADHAVAEASADKHWRNLMLLQARVEELERLLGLCSAWINPNLVIMETGEFLKPVVLKALAPQPQKETPQ